MKDITFKEKVKQGINDLFYIWLREFRLQQYSLAKKGRDTNQSSML